MRNRKPVLRWVILASAGAVLASFVWWCFFTLDSPIPQRREAMVRRLTHQPTLAQIATNDSDREVRLAAVDKLTDQALLNKIAVEDSDRIVRAAAIRRLHELSP
jgi:hypothetical protein